METVVVTKMCTQCKQEKPGVDEFFPMIQRNSGLKPTSWCRECINSRSCEWAKKNPEKTNAKNARWRKTHPEQNAAMVKDWNLRNPEKRAEHKKRWQQKNPEKSRALFDRFAERNPERLRALQFRSSIKRLYGITPEDYESMLVEQGGVCAICKKAPDGEGRNSRLHIDHDHKTGRVRGLLHWNCNLGLGAFGDDADIMMAAIEYIKKNTDIVSLKEAV